MRNSYSYKWAAKRVDNVLGLAFAIPNKKKGDAEDDAPEESLMKSGQKVNPHLMKAWAQ